MSDARFYEASQLAADIAAKAEELETAIYQAHKMGYRVALRVENVVPVFKGDGEIRLIGAQLPVAIRATIPFDIGRAVL